MASLVKFSLESRFIPDIYFPPPVPLFLWRTPGPDSICPYDEENVPKHAFLKGSNKTIPDIGPISAKLSMCREARELIESFEPDVHQFFPVEITRKRSTKPIYRLDGRILEEPYFLFNVQTILDAVWIDRSQLQVFRHLPDATPVVGALPGNYNIVLRKSVIDGHHIWRGGYQMGHNLFFSDALVAAIEAKRLRKLEFHHLEEA
jgi:hypothetical protein